MDEIDWNQPATLHERDDSGSDMNYDFRTVRKASLGELVRDVAAMSGDERARIVIDVAGGRTLGIGEVLELAKREDLP
jgi:hypothetical protein